MVKESDLEWVFIDDICIKARQHSSSGNESVQAISKSVAGRATKIHLVVDAYGNPITFILSDETIHEVKVALDLINKTDLSNADMVCADKGYDSDTLREHIKQAGSIINIPKNRNTKTDNSHMDWYLYKARH